MNNYNRNTLSTDDEILFTFISVPLFNFASIIQLNKRLLMGSCI